MSREKLGVPYEFPQNFFFKTSSEGTLARKKARKSEKEREKEAENRKK